MTNQQWWDARMRELEDELRVWWFSQLSTNDLRFLSAAHISPA